MANTHSFETKFSKRMQASFYNMPIFRGIVNFEERANLSDGQSVVRPRKSIMTAADYTRGTDASLQTITEANETLTVNTAKIVPFSIDDLDKVQSNYPLMNEYADDAMSVINSSLDGDILAEYTNATSTVDDGDLGGTAGNPFTATTSNWTKAVSKAMQKLQEQNVDLTGMMALPGDFAKKIGFKGLVGKGFGAVSPQLNQLMVETLGSRESDLGDRVGVNGFQRSYLGFDMMLSNNTAWSAVLNLATNPTNGDTVVIDGVTFTFVSTIGSTAGNVLIAGAVDGTRANLEGAINSPTTTDANQVAVSSTRSNNYTLADSEKMDLFTATNDDTADTLSLVAKERSWVALSETLTDVTDAFVKETQHNLFGKKGAIDMVIQVAPKVSTSDIPLQLGKYVKPHVLYGKKTFNEGARQLVDVQINTAAF